MGSAILTPITGRILCIVGFGFLTGRWALTGGGGGTIVLTVLFRTDESDLGQFEWIEDGKEYREWLIPAAYVNANARVMQHTVDQSPAIESELISSRRAFP
jgi:hypothetical protein